MRIVRVALVQVEVHPALTLGHIAYLDEPFIQSADADAATLSGLAASGIPTGDLSVACRTAYLEWEDRRIRAILRSLARLAPTPDLVIFPEASVPARCLPAIAAWSDQHKTNVIAGSHSPELNAQGRRRYNDLGFDRAAADQIAKYESENCVALIRRGRLLLIPKSVPSVYERSDTATRHAAIPKPRPLPIETNSGKHQLLVLNCAEALRAGPESETADLTAVVAHHRKPNDFHRWAEQRVSNRDLVAVCNAGQFGGSRFHVPTDSRTKTWLTDVFPEGLPRGDTILVADVDLDCRTVEVGVTDPKQALSLVGLSAVVGDRSSEMPISRAFQAAAQAPDHDTCARQLKTAGASPGLKTIWKARIDRLAFAATHGAPRDTLTAEMGSDCVIPAGTSLKELEADLAALCANGLHAVMTKAATYPPDVLKAIMQFWGKCQERRSAAPTVQPPAPSLERHIVDREEEIARVEEFLNRDDRPVLLLTGLPQIGKTSLLRKAFGQLGVREIRTVLLNPSPSAEYLAAAAAGLDAKDAAIVFPAHWIRKELGSHLAGLKILIIENAHYLLDYGIWKDVALRDAFLSVVEVCRESNVKVVVESRRHTPIDEHPILEMAQRLKVPGLDDKRARFGIQLFDSQLRRVDLSVDILQLHEKERVVSRLSGHPKALEMAANVCIEDGPETLMKMVADGKGSLFLRVSRLAKYVAIDEVEREILALLSHAREGIPREAVTSSTTVAATVPIRYLIDAGFIVLDDRGWIRVPSLFQPFFLSVQTAPERVAQFHKSAAHHLAQACKGDTKDIATAIEAEYHARLAGVEPEVSVPLVDAAIGAANQLFQDQAYDEAYKIISSVLKRGRSTQALRLGALIAARLRKLDEAVALAKECFEKDKQDTTLLSQLGRIALTQRHEALAEELANTADKAGIEDAEIHILRGRIALRRKKLMDALHHFERATKLTEHNPWAFVHLGETYMRLGQHDKAIDALQDGETFFYETNSRWQNALNAIKTKLGVCYLMRGDLEYAATYIEGIAEDQRSPESALALAALTIRRDGIENSDRALERLRGARIRDRQDRCQFHLFAGQFFLGLNELQKANREFEKAYEADRGNVFAMIQWSRNSLDLALEYFASGEDAYLGYAKNAQKVAAKVLEFDRGNADATDLLERLAANFPALSDGDG